MAIHNLDNQKIFNGEIKIIDCHENLWFSRNDILPPRHCEALAEAIHNLVSRL